MSTAFIQEVLRLTNEFRAQNGLTPLTLNQTLASAAQKHSENMATSSTFFSHWDSRGWDQVDRNDAERYTGTTRGENISGHLTPEAVVNGWINSAGHRANMLDRDATEIGIGHYQEQTDSDRDGITNYTTQVFGIKNGQLPAARAGVLVGTDGDDVLTGSAGRQYLVGSKGNDTLTGGAGADYFVFTSLNQGLDKIKDFNPAQGDQIVLVGKDFLPSGGIWPKVDYSFSTGMLSVGGKDLVQLEGSPGYSYQTVTMLSQIGL